VGERLGHLAPGRERTGCVEVALLRLAELAEQREAVLARDLGGEALLEGGGRVGPFARVAGGVAQREPRTEVIRPRRGRGVKKASRVVLAAELVGEQA